MENIRENEHIPLIIGFSGKMGSGKDYIAKEVVGKYLRTQGIQYIHMAFGDVIKVKLMATMETSYESLYVKKTVESRRLLQTVSMESRKTDDKIWIKYLDAWIKVYGTRGIDVILISDVRFPIEYEYIKEKGGLVFRIIAPMRTLKKMNEETNNNDEEIKKIKEHISEIALDDYEYSLYNGIIYNDGGDDSDDDNGGIDGGKYNSPFIGIKSTIGLIKSYIDKIL